VNGKRFSPTEIGRILAPVADTFRRHRFRLAAGLLALLMVDGLQLVIPVLLRKAVDQITSDTASSSSLLRYTGMIVTIAGLVLLCRFLWRVLVIGFSRFLEQDLRDRLFPHLLTLDRTFHQRHSTGELMAHASNDLGAVQVAFGMGMAAALDALVLTLASIILLVRIDPFLTAIALAPLAFLALAARILARHLHQAFTRVQEQFGRLTEKARSVLESIVLVQAYGLAPFQARAMDRLGRDYVRANIRVAAVQGMLHPLSLSAGNLGMALVLWFGGRAVIDGRISLGELVAFMTYLSMLIWPMMAVGWVTSLAQRGLTSLVRINELLQAGPSHPVGTLSPTVKPESPRLSIQELFFTYPDSQYPVLRGVNLKLNPGLTGLTGPSGSGKTTLCRLLTGQYPPQHGEIRLNGHSLVELAPTWLRGRIAYVGQEAMLFSGTIAANIAQGSPRTDQAAVEHAARLACIHDEIMALDKGYQTRIGEKGVRLSGGQRQRICLARALLVPRPVLIIDDGLSALDADTEARIMAMLVNRSSHGIILLVSHRPSVLDRCQRQVVLDSGRIVALGQTG